MSEAVNLPKTAWAVGVTTLHHGTQSGVPALQTSRGPQHRLHKRLLFPEEEFHQFPTGGSKGDWLYPLLLGPKSILSQMQRKDLGQLFCTPQSPTTFMRKNFYNIFGSYLKNKLQHTWSDRIKIFKCFLPQHWTYFHQDMFVDFYQTCKLFSRVSHYGYKRWNIF